MQGAPLRMSTVMKQMTKLQDDSNLVTINAKHAAVLSQAGLTHSPHSHKA
jgi:hypothetical protein